MKSSPRPQNLEQIVKATGRLAHDFGNYLTGILGFTELAAKHLPEGSQARAFLTEAWRSAKDGAGWVLKLQAMSRAKPASFEAADLAGVMREEQERLRPILTPAMTLTITLEPNLPPVNVERGALRQMIGHFLDNAVEALPGSGTISVSGRPVTLLEKDCQEIMGGPSPGPFVNITITDSGVGLPPGLEQRFLSEFFYSTKPGQRGVGLLAAFWALHQYQGGMRFGPHPEPGSAITLFLPYDPARRSA